ncbi:MAG TPA: DinB family protein [Gemmatimonadaceae bacterium]|jgi:hypothetical protein|nr:DinB family protein [Gemmatimonadaceae bacterium]
MSNTASRHGTTYDPGTEPLGRADRARSRLLAERLERGAAALDALARTLTDDEWETRVPKDGRRIGVIVHHVASMYPLEIELAFTLAAGKPVTGVTLDDVHVLNGNHAAAHDTVTKEETLELLERNSAAAAAAVRTLSDAELDRAFPVSLNADAPLTCQFFIEDHALRHSYHHLARIRATLEARETGPRAALD